MAESTEFVPESETDKADREVGIAMVVVIVVIALAVGALVVYHSVKKAVACPPAPACENPAAAVPVIDDKSVMCVADPPAGGRDELIRQLAEDRRFYKNELVYLPDQLTGCHQTPKRQCLLEPGGVLTIQEDSDADDRDTKKGLYRTTKTDRRQWMPDPENAGLNECPAGIVAFSESALRNMLAHSEDDVLEKFKLDRIFTK